MNHITLFILVFVHTLWALSAAGPVPASLNKRIYNGNALPACTAPFEVSVATIRGNIASTCGGTLISPRHVITAAHCLLPYNTSYPVKIGYNSQNKSQQTVVQATKVTIHPKYIANEDDSRYDIAILEIPSVKFSKHTQRMPIYNATVGPGQDLLAVGWGKVESSKIARDALRGTTVVVGGVQECQEYKRDFLGASDARVCALGRLTPGAGICGGDSGSSVSIAHKGQQYFVGLSSRIVFFNGDTCGGKDSASFFVRIGYFLDYIAESTGLTHEYLLNQDAESSSPYSALPSSSPVYTALPIGRLPPSSQPPDPTPTEENVVTVTITEYLIRTARP
ncbi:hypothetical protein LPJ70_000434 [Coemansia sp. RSA 2708]|nr:hypothetical protein LPJ70_000434 [Coemansia sp. RSA 2708]KAJ2731615.1 hypothetical protein H4R23_003035 [Coemansia sp. Cherry 401B]